MLTKRIIACLDVTEGRVVKGVKFLDLIDAGDPAELARRHAESGADEVVLLDITATHQSRPILIDAVRRAARELFVPFTVGGGVRTLDDATGLFEAGADKITMNSAAVRTPELIGEVAERFGSQAVVVAIDAKRGNTPVEEAEVYVSGGRIPTGLKCLDWAREVERRGAGEILLTSMDRDGTQHRLRLPADGGGGARAFHSGDRFRRRRQRPALRRCLQGRAAPTPRWPLPSFTSAFTTCASSSGSCRSKAFR